MTAPASGDGACASCAGPLAHDQRYCLACGARRPGPRRDALALLGAAGTPRASADVRPSRPPGLERRRRAALPIALATLVALVVVAGTRAPDTLAGGLVSGLTVVLPAPAAAPSPPADDGTTASAEPPPADTPVSDTPPAPADDGTDDTGDQGTGTTPDDGAGDNAPAIHHVFLVMLAQSDVAALARDRGAAPYLAGTLAKKGTLLTGYQAIAHGELANEIALLSGQGPTHQTLADCPTYAEVTPDQLGADSQQLGDGCVYPPEAGTIADELHGAGKQWRAYVEDVDVGGATGCRHPALGAPDDLRSARPGDAYATYRNPFAYFHSLLDGDCARYVVGLDRLDADLARGAKAPALSYIAPNLCHDGRATACAPGAPAGPAAADAFLKTLVPKIFRSQAYADGGLIVIASDGVPQAPEPAPAVPPAPSEPATTTTDPVTTPTTTTTTTSTSSTTTQTTPTTTGPNAAPRSSTNARAARAASATRTVPPRASAADTGAALPSPCCGLHSFPNVGDAAAVGAGPRLGALLISKQVRAGATDATPANPFTLLRTLEDIFQLQPLGYAGAAATKPLPQRVLPSAPS